MRTSTISYRVADFLKRYPPFEFLDEAELLDLASHGRVKMHEAGERLFWEGREPGPYVFIIQQGTVRLVNETDEGEELRDILGAGDLLGVGRFLGQTTYRHTARAATDVVLYCLQAGEVEQLVARHEEVARYLEATMSVGGKRSAAEDTTGETSRRRRRSWIDEAGPPAALTTRRLLTCLPDTTIRSAAERMAETGSNAVVVTDTDRLPLGLVTTSELRDRVATAQVSPDACVDTIMRPAPATALPARRVGDYLLPMMRAGDELVVVTADGTPATPAEGLVTDRDLTVRHGTDPAGLARELRLAPSVAELAVLHRRIQSLLVEQLTDTGALDWLLPAVGELQRALIQRVVELATAEWAGDSGTPPVELETCWLRFGSAGREELLTVHDLDFGLVYADPPAAEAARTRGLVEALGQRVGSGLRAAGFIFSSGVRVVSDPMWCQPLSVWKDRYTGWIRDPIRQEIYRARALFDFQGISDRSPMVDALRRHIGIELDGNDAFIAVLANDTLANQPPLTFFQGLVVDDEEARTAHLDMVRSALQPLTDVGRVFALDTVAVETTSTCRRLEQAGRHDPEHQVLLDEAAEAFRIALLHRARAGLRDGHDGAVVNAASLTRYEQTVLKSVFRAVATLLEVTERRYLGSRG